MKHNCPVCGQYEFDEEDSFDVCPNCGWGDDMCQENKPDLSGGFNKMSLNKAKEAYEKGQRIA